MILTENLTLFFFVKCIMAVQTRVSIQTKSEKCGISTMFKYDGPLLLSAEPMRRTDLTSTLKPELNENSKNDDMIERVYTFKFLGVS